KIVFGTKDIASTFAKYRKPFRKPGMTNKKIMKLVDAGIELMLKDSLPEILYNEKMMNDAYALRNSSTV
ncbi:hypothetical protein B1B_09178, partial [mine drainage metagenome]